MQFKTFFLSAAAFTVAIAQPTLTNTNFAPVAGQPFDITWSGAEGNVQLILKNGLSTNLQTVGTIASGLTGTSYSWTPPASLDDGLYSLEIIDESNVPNYSSQFQVAGTTGASTTAESSTAASSTTVESSTTTDASTTTTETSSTTDASSTTGTDSSSATGTASTTTTGSANTTSTASKTDSTLSKTASKTSPSSSPATAAPTSSAGGLSSPLAFIFLAFAAIVMVN